MDNTFTGEKTIEKWEDAYDLFIWLTKNDAGNHEEINNKIVTICHIFSDNPHFQEAKRRWDETFEKN